MTQETFIVLIVIVSVLAIFGLVPLVIYLIIRKIFDNRHKERMAMIEKGLIMSRERRENTAPYPESVAEEEKNVSPQQPTRVYHSQYQPKAEDSTVKWMYILGGLGIGLLISSVVTDLLNYYTVMDTGGIGFSIVILSVCGALALYYRVRVRGAKKEYSQYQEPKAEGGASQDTPKKEEYTED